MDIMGIMLSSYYAYFVTAAVANSYLYVDAGIEMIMLNYACMCYDYGITDVIDTYIKLNPTRNGVIISTICCWGYSQGIRMCNDADVINMLINMTLVDDY